ncbi:MAG: TIR domain-containing protein [Rhodobacter sp.]|nr:TIR domain-containing protein [Rhodobacter sp.]
MTRRVFYSFHYELDAWRAAQVRNMGVVEGNEPARDNDWETVKRGGDAEIKRWISRQMERRTCTIVLAGAKTAGRDWITHEIVESWNRGMGVAGIHIHGLIDKYRMTAAKGGNPFEHVSFNGGRLSSIVKCHDPPGGSSRERLAWIRKNLAAIIEDAIDIREKS